MIPRVAGETPRLRHIARRLVGLPPRGARGYPSFAMAGILHRSSKRALVYSGFGLAQGEVIEGNMGSQFKRDYTIIGNAVNEASRLEKLTRKVKCSLVLSEPLKHSAKESWSFVSLGKHGLRGKKISSEVYSIDDDIVNNYEKDSKQMIDLINKK